MADNTGEALELKGAKQLINQTLKSLKKISGDKYAPELIPIIEELKLTLTYLNGDNCEKLS